MGIKLGNNDIELKVGSANTTIYLGDTLVENGDTPSPYYTEYFTFVATESGTFKFSGQSIYYSIDNGSTWVELASDTASPTVSAGDKIMWKATIQTYVGIGTFSSTGAFTVEGNIMSLLYGDGFKNKTSFGNNRQIFMNLFESCSGLTSAENLVLPATTLTENCYGIMFSNCSSLTEAPVLSATTLANHCYQAMFRGCTSLTTAPQLPATTLAVSCYYCMFSGCTSLTTAPQLPATTLTDACYQNMFQDCTSLTTAPALPATTLTSSQCYERMFQGCTNLSNITCLATDRSAYNCTEDWVYGVQTNSGTFTKAASMSSWPTGSSGIPSNWTVQDYQG